MEQLVKDGGTVLRLVDISEVQAAAIVVEAHGNILATREPFNPSAAIECAQTAMQLGSIASSFIDRVCTGPQENDSTEDFVYDVHASNQMTLERAIATFQAQLALFESYLTPVEMMEAQMHFSPVPEATT